MPPPRSSPWAVAWMTALLLALPATAHANEEAVRVGHFPNVTHGQALIGRGMQWFERRVTRPIAWKPFNAGPSAMEAILAGALDLSYVGPSPAINVHVRSKGKAIRIVAGAASGGALLIVRDGAGITRPEDFRGKKVAAPELGNTQDVVLRHWLQTHGLKPRSLGGDVEVLSVKNPDILTLFQRRELDAAWVPEPWATRLLQEGGGTLFLDERALWPDGQFTTVVLVARGAFADAHPEVIAEFVAAHTALTEWITQHPDEARRALGDALAKEMGQPLPEPVLRDAFARITFTADPIPGALTTYARWAWELGYLPGDAPPDLSGLFAQR